MTPYLKGDTFKKPSFFYGWSTNPPGPRTPPAQEIAGLIKGLLTIGFP